jgi:DNA-binding MarR family transcriptional regulator
VSNEYVAEFRRFNRYFTRRIGALDDHYLGQDRPLGEARLLFAIGDGASLRELRSRLGLDSGHLSRIARALEAQGMVRLRVHPRDSRLRMFEQTPTGRTEVAEQNGRADRPRRRPPRQAHHRAARPAHRGHGHHPAPAPSGRHHRHEG